MERLIQYVWKYRLYEPDSLVDTEGLPITIIDPGIHNTHAGPDFFNAKIRIGDQLWAGNIEIHSSPADWYKHGHHEDAGYNSVILHIALTYDSGKIVTQEGRTVPQLTIKIPEKIAENYEYLLFADRDIPCLGRIKEIAPIHLTDWKNALTIERLENKSNRIESLLNQTKGDWEEVFYITLARNLGFGINGDAFERLAGSLPLRYIQKHRDSLFQIEALLFGQAGLLEEENEDDAYYSKLRQESLFLRNKFSLHPLDEYLFKKLRTRPYNSPHIKIAQFAAMLHEHESLFSKVLEAQHIEQYFALFTPSVSAYWQSHFYFHNLSVKSEKKLSPNALFIVLINTVVPVLFAYGKKKKRTDLVDYSLQLLERLPPEKNSIVTLFERAGLSVVNAADTQAVIQLKREYCEKKECLFCRIGHKLLSKVTL